MHLKKQNMFQYTNIPPHSVKKMAELYKEAPDEIDQIPGNAFYAFKKLVHKQFVDITDNMDVIFSEDEPYGLEPKLADMVHDFRLGVLRIHTSGNDSQLWGAFTNLEFRAVHDYIHCLHGLEFTHADECRAYTKQFEFSLKYADRVPYVDWDIYNRVLRSEIVYQSAFKEQYNEFHIDQKIILNTEIISKSRLSEVI